MTETNLDRDFQNAMDILSDHFTSQQYNDEMHDLTEKYKKEMLAWFESDTIDADNPMQCATQEHWYSLYLEKKRLRTRNYKMQYTIYDHIKKHYEDAPGTICSYHRDGKYLVCEASQLTHIAKTYTRNGVIIGQENQNRDISYYILRSKNENGLYICPNCGAPQTLDALLDGCDYCKTKFDISAYDDKVMSVMRNKSTFDTRESNTSKLTIWLVVAILGVIGVFAGFVGIIFTFGLSLLLVPFGVLATILGVKGANNSSKGVQANTQWKYKLQDHNPDFSEEEFIGSLDCKLKSIHYATNPQELAAFVKCDIAPFVKNYQNIINCEIGKIAFKNYRIDGEYQYLDIHREIEVLQDCGNYLKPAMGIIAVTLAKKVQYKFKNDVTICHCNHCNSSISLVEGGKCKYCGTEMDYAAYDWIVVNYQHVKEL